MSPFHSTVGPISSYTTPRSNRPSSRDRRIATGLDNSLMQAIAQMGPSRNVDHAPSVHSERSSGSRRSHRRSGRRRRYHGHPHHTAYRHGDRYRYNSDGPSDQEQYCTSASEAEQTYSRRRTSRSAPISPIHPDPDDPNEPDYDVLPPPPPHIQVQAATPINMDRGIPQSPTAIPNHLTLPQIPQSHYDYPRCYYTNQQAHTQKAPPSHLAQESPPTHPEAPPTHLTPQTSTPARSTAYEHLPPLNLSVGNQAENSSTVHQSESSPIASRRQHPPSPLAIHSHVHSSSFSETSGGGTPRSSAEVQHVIQSNAGQTDGSGFLQVQVGY